jgi:L-iditol 2-dehydrogenase
MISTGQINLDQIISRVAGLEDWNECFAKMQTGEYVKAVLRPV